MPTSTLGLNGVDLLMAVILASTVYIRRTDGIVAELFKLFGIFCMVFITLHYYERLADVLRVQFFGKEADTEFVAFGILAVSVFLAFFFISGGWPIILKIKSVEIIDRWGNVALSLVRGYFVCSMIFLALLLSNIDPFVSKTRSSMSSAMFSGGAVGLYRASYSGIIEKFFPGEPVNEEVFKLIGTRSGKSKK
jgi:uncharacterized membrane protein required for colicin V production